MTVIVLYTLLVALSLFVIAALPRAVARFLSPGAWSLGWTLRHSPPRARDPLQRVPTAKRAADWHGATVEKHVATSDRDKAYNWTDRYAIQAPRVAPRHVPSLRTFLFPISRQFSKTICGYSVGQTIILACYAVIIGFGILFYSNPVTNPQRAGWIAVSQYPVAVLLASKNSLIGLLVGKGYEKLNYLHRWVGRLMFISIVFHVVSFRELITLNISAVIADISVVVKWTKMGILTQNMTGPMAVTGSIALGGVSFLAIGSLPAVRNRMWTVFSCSHWVGFGVAMGAVRAPYVLDYVAQLNWITQTAYHVPETLLWCLVSSGIYGLDLLLRIVQSHYVTATVYYVPELKATRVVVPELRSGWRAGQHVRMTVLSSAMGVTQTLETHPFTIASTSEDEEGLVLYCHERGDWTRSLATLARGRIGGGISKFREAGSGSGQRVNVLIQGPYGTVLQVSIICVGHSPPPVSMAGGPGNTMFSSYSAAMFICGGSGITFGLGATQDVIRDAFDRRSRLRLVDLVWTVQDACEFMRKLADRAIY